MFDLTEIVIPKIMNKWEDALGYDDIATINAIRECRSIKALLTILQGLVDD